MTDFAQILKADPFRSANGLAPLPKSKPDKPKNVTSPASAAYTNGQEGTVAGWPAPPLRQDGPPSDQLGYEYGGPRQAGEELYNDPEDPKEGAPATARSF